RRVGTHQSWNDAVRLIPPLEVLVQGEKPAVSPPAEAHVAACRQDVGTNARRPGDAHLLLELIPPEVGQLDIPTRPGLVGRCSHFLEPLDQVGVPTDAPDLEGLSGSGAGEGEDEKCDEERRYRSMESNPHFVNLL